MCVWFDRNSVCCPAAQEASHFQESAGPEASRGAEPRPPCIRIPRAATAADQEVVREPHGDGPLELRCNLTVLMQVLQPDWKYAGTNVSTTRCSVRSPQATVWMVIIESSSGVLHPTQVGERIHFNSIQESW